MGTCSQSAEAAIDRCPNCGLEVSVATAAAMHYESCPLCHRPLTFVRKLEGEEVVLTFLPGLPPSPDEEERWLAEAVAAVGDAPRTVVNLGHLPTVASYFLSSLMALQRRLARSRRKLRLCGVQPHVAEVLKTTRLDALFDICADEKAVVK